MRQYQSYLPEFAREIAVVYCTAIMEFYQGNFEEAESLLLRVVDQEFDGFVSGVKARTYLLKTYFEQGKYDEMEKLLNSFRMYVRRNKLLTAGSKQNYTRRINSMRKLMNLSLLPFESDKVKQFGSELQAQKSPAVHKKWMLRKVNEMS